MFLKLFLIFTAVPVLELVLLIKIGSSIGVLPTIFIVVMTAIAGAYLVRMEGIGVMTRIQEHMRQGIFPGDELINGVLILVAGALLLTPGFFTDVLGFLFVFPRSREYIKKFAKVYIRRKMNRDEIEIHIS
ncbi:MAG: FxsA family protein [Nitrospiraceae bacterium]|nr:MAG: FxsA family protein [Nitrospiraceae bacterium]